MLAAITTMSQVGAGLALTARQPAEATSAITADSSPLRKVVTLIQEMKATVEKEATEDREGNEKYMCWCKTNEEAKNEAITEAKDKIEELNAFLEEANAKDGELVAEIKGLAKDIADDQDALATATATRKKEMEEFLAEEADLKETLGLLKDAVTTLQKVQLVQKEGHASPKAQEVLLQFKEKVEKLHPKYQNVMQRDLFDMLGALQLPGEQGNGFLQKGGLLPWEKTDEQKGAEAKPNDLEGAAAGAKSYNPKSGRILGILSEMGDETARDLGESQKADFKAEVAFQKLRAAKLSEISAATEEKERKEASLADLRDKVAKSKEDKEATVEALDADQTFLARMLKDCKIEEEEFVKRAKVRSQEEVALAETLKILTEDDARELFGKTVSFLQVSRTSAMLQDKASQRAMLKLATVAKKYKNWALVSLAVRTRLDAFTKVKAAMDKMMKELSTQQKEEYAKWEQCKADIDKTEDKIWEGENTEEDLAEKYKLESNKIETLENDIASLKKEIEDMEISLKQAGEQRKEENGLFQTSVMDQRATVNILNKALARLKAFYTPGLVQLSEEQPGRAIAPPPPKGQAYQKSGGAGGVVQLIMKIIEEAEVEGQQLKQGEQRAQQIYAEFVSTTKETIEADRDAIEKKTELLAETESARSETKADQLANNEFLDNQRDILKAHHLDCDWLLKYFDIRQKARAEEMDAIEDAKAVLSGADFER